MARRLYPLNAVRAFEAAARHLSFVRAAAELHVTPGAISHQVKGLEEFLGVPLFQRLPRGLLLADAGQVLLPELGGVFSSLETALERVQESRSQGALTISVAPMFAVKWLLPRLQGFNELHPEIDVRMSSSLGLVDFQRDAFDAAIRLGRGPYPGLRSEILFDESVTPLCSPRLLKRQPPPTGPDALRHHLLLHDDSMAFDAAAPNWETWLGAAGVTGVDASRGPHFSQPDHALQAAIDGVGIVLGWRYLAANDVAAGRVVAPFDLALPLGSAFNLVYPEAHAGRRKLTAFRNWLFAQTRPDPT